MTNKWKRAFWIQFVLFMSVILLLAYQLISFGYRITYMKEGYEDTEHDLQQIAASIKGKLTKADFHGILERFPDSSNLHEINLNRTIIRFDKNDKVDSIKFR